MKLTDRAMGRVAAIAIAAAALGLGYVSNATAAEELKKVAFVFDWSTPDHELIPILAAQDQGYYKEQGLDVSITLPPDSQTTGRLLVSGQADIGFEGTTDVAFAVEQGIPIVSIASYTQGNNWCLVGRPGEPVDLTKLEGKSIGIYTDSWTKAMMPFVLKKAGLREDQVKLIIATSADIPLLLANKIDIATNTENYALPQVQAAVHKNPTFTCAKDFGAPDVPVWVYTATKPWLAANGDTARKWLAATEKGMAWSAEHPEDAVAIFGKHYQQEGSGAYNLIAWKALIPLLRSPDGYFVQYADKWTQLAQALKDTGQITKVASPNSYFTNEYLPQH